MLLLSPAALGESSSPSTACVCSRIPSRSLASSSFAAASALEPSGERRSSPPTAEASCQPDESRGAEVSAALSVELSAASVSKMVSSKIYSPVRTSVTRGEGGRVEQEVPQRPEQGTGK